MDTPQGAVSATPDVTGGSLGSGVSQTADSSPAQSTATSSADVNTQQAVQGGTQTTQQDDPLAGLPSNDDLATMVAQKVPNAEAVQRLRSAYEPLKTQFDELSNRFKVFEPVADRFEAPEQIQSVLELQDSLLGWAPDPENPGAMVPATEVGAQRLAEQYPQHADFLTADLLALPTRDPSTGQMVPRIDVVLAGMREDPTERAKALQILGGVEPSAVAPQWAPSQEEISAIAADPANPTPQEKALQDLYRTLPWEKREELKLASPDFVREYLQDQQLKRELIEHKQRSEQETQQRQQQREQYLNQQAQQAGDEYVSSQLNDALSTFHKSVVEQCQFIKPLDPANLPQGISPEQAQQMNQQIDRANKSEAVQMTATVVGLLNPQVRSYILPLMKEVGLIDDKTLGQIETAANNFAMNARNFGNITYRGKLQANGNGYQPDASVTRLNNEAGRNLKALVGYANLIRKSLMDTRSGFFELRAQQHNETLNGSPTVRPSINGHPFDPTRSVSTANQPTGWQTRADFQRQYG